MGRIGQGPEAVLFARYAARLRPALITTELPDGRGAPAEIKRREGAAILAALPDRALVVALDPRGAEMGSEAFARHAQHWRETARPVCFLIGGAEGLDRLVLDRADHALCFGRMTWPHLLVRTMLAEQLFRAQSIMQGHPYHRGGG